MSNQHMRRRGADPMMGVSKFLLERIAEDEESARHPHEMSCSSLICTCTSRPDDLAPLPDEGRVLAECEAKRRIVEHWKSTVEWAEDPGCDSPDRYLMVAAGLYEAMRHLAEPFADHPDYQPSWRP
jgi:hypothetical protein